MQDNAYLWDCVAKTWKNEISSEVRNLIKKEVKVFGKVLEVGSGSVQYFSKSSVLDFSKKMLSYNPAKTKFLHDLEKPLPFKNKEFDFVVACFVINYVKNFDQLISEMKRVGKNVIIVQANTSPKFSDLIARNNEVFLNNPKIVENLRIYKI